MIQPDEETMDLLTGCVCDLAALQPKNGWPDEVKRLVAAARGVKKLYGMEVVTLSSAERGEKP
jgi:hypothetical protein